MGKTDSDILRVLFSRDSRDRDSRPDQHRDRSSSHRWISVQAVAEYKQAEEGVVGNHLEEGSLEEGSHHLGRLAEAAEEGTKT